MNGELKTAIARAGQRYLDEPVVVRPKEELSTPIAHAVLGIFNGYTYGDPDGSGRMLMPLPVGMKKQITVRHDRFRLRWMKPDGKGGLVPK